MKRRLSNRLRGICHRLAHWWCDRHGLAIVHRAHLESIRSEIRNLRHTDGPFPDLSNFGKDTPEVTS